MGKGGKGRGGGGGYPWWEHLKNKGGGKGTGDDKPSTPRKPVGTKGTTLQKTLQQMEGGGYPSYKDLMGAPWDMENCSGAQVFFDRVQGDPYAPPSWVRVRVPARSANFPAEYVTDSAVRNVALCDFLTRVLSDMLRGGTGTDWTKAVAGEGWSGSKGGDVQIDTPGQYVLSRSCMVATKDHVEARLTLSLPARGRSIEGHRAAEIVGGLMDAVKSSLFHDALDKDALRSHILSAEDQASARGQLSKLGLVAFVANGSVLPRKSGVDDRPMTKEDDPNLVLFESPASMETSLTVPNRGTITGMGVKKGITLIVGGGFHGKSTLLQALQLGVYNKVDGDGREFVVCDEAAVKIRAEDGRFVACADISPFINNLPFGKDTTQFTTSDASGSTSQAANIVEALELGASCLLIDEDSCATNFMIRDAPMVELVAPDKEPITPFVKRVKPLFQDQGVSTVMVIGGSGDFFSLADTVICMERYMVTDVTAKAHEIAEKHGRGVPALVPFPASVSRRVVLKEGLAADHKVSAKSMRCITYGNTEIELTFVEQLVEVGQAKAIMDCLQHLAANSKYVDGKRTLVEVVQMLESALHSEGQAVGENGLDTISSGAPCPFHACPRRFELAAALNRLRT
eukprot:CAMPEP_0178388602 /NCGR_PEP_ID=MMETSP0689_2-20121128/9680_1 /TAXON_ID=160604 /ORGANISM="Amphidinium massartii, Strain CS-259" /LENGTH=626 /DNA_ID=CAMNT_0020009015 /DNA_START=116 /DNA_END=1992 /DNA_ORIENTATION=-